MIFRTCVFLFLVCSASALHETVVQSVLKKVSDDLIKANTKIDDFNYDFSEDFGGVSTKFRIYTSSGQIVVTGLELSGSVQYDLPDPSGSANFKFSTALKVFITYRYSATGAGAIISHGVFTGTWNSQLDMSLDVEPTGCSLKLRDVSRKTQTFEVEVQPKDGTFYPVTLRFPPGDHLEKHIESTLSDLLTKSFNEKKICDCVECISS